MEVFEQLWNAFNDIEFDEREHKFVSSDVKDYTSVTTFLNRFQKETNWDLIATKYAKKHKREQIDVINEWHKNGEYATTLGTEIHSVMELLWNKKYYVENRKILNEKNAVDDFNKRRSICKEIFSKLKDTYIPVAEELVVYDKESKIAGIIDFLAYNKIKKCYSILDWKTSKEIKLHNNFQNMLKPFEQYDDCNYIHYSLQLSLYKYIIEQFTDLKIDELRLIQIVDKPKICDCIDFSEVFRNEHKSKQSIFDLGKE